MHGASIFFYVGIAISVLCVSVLKVWSAKDFMRDENDHGSPEVLPFRASLTHVYYAVKYKYVCIIVVKNTKREFCSLLSTVFMISLPSTLVFPEEETPSIKDCPLRQMCIAQSRCDDPCC